MASKLQPRLLYSYLATEMLAPFFASFLIINCVFLLVKLIPFLNFVLELDIGFADFIRILSYLFPNIFLYTLPMAAMLGVTIGFTRLTNDSEILALKASGISVFTMIPPVVIITSAIALFAGYFSTHLIPLSGSSMKQMTQQLLREKASKGIKAHNFTEALGDVVVHVDSIDKKTGQWSNVWVSDMRDATLPTIVMAKTGQMTSEQGKMSIMLQLDNGSLHKPGDHQAQIVQFERYQLNIPLKPPQGKAARVKDRDIMSMGELLDAAAKITTQEKILKAATTTMEGQKKIKKLIYQKRKYLIEFHKRLVLPAGCMLISLLGLPLGLQARPGKKAIGIQAGLGIFILYYILFTYGKTMAEDGVLPVIVSMWLPNAFFFILTLFWIYRIAMEKPLVPETITSAISALPEKTGLKKTRIFDTFHIRKQKLSARKQQLLFRLRRKKVVRGEPKRRIFHIQSCHHFTSTECTLSFKDKQTAVNAGFSPCRKCMPGEKYKKQQSETE